MIIPFKNSPLPGLLPPADEAVIVVAGISVFREVTVSKEEELRAAAMRADNARSLFLAGRRLVRGILSQWLGITAADVPITLAASGRPSLQGEGMPCFSISHSGDLVAALFSHADAGIDLERERPVDVASLARRFFSTGEAAALSRSCEAAEFFRLWTCREAAIKADGRGMGSLLARTGAAPLDNGLVSVEIEGVPWTAFPWALDGGYHGAVAFREPPGLIRWCDLR